MSSETFHLDTQGIYRCKHFSRFPWQNHGFGTRFASPHADVTLRQIHSAVVWNAKGLSDRGEEGDALVSNQVGLRIGIRTADCVPLLLLDQQTRAVAAVHAGWRGTADGVVRCAIRRMHREFGSDTADVYAALGPSIRECCYEVSADVATRFASQFPEWGPVSGSRYIDLVEANRRQMILAGVAPENIFDSELCTACDVGTLFSYRREPDNPGRMVAVIARMI